MVTRRQLLGAGATCALAASLPALMAPVRAEARFPVQLDEAGWRRRLSPEAFTVLRHEGTEPPYSSPLNAEHRRGTFLCAGCAQPLFASATKFDSGTGWPSFWRPLPHAVAERSDRSLVTARTEVHCTRCGGHLGHVFDDGPKPTGLRYCMNGAAMSFRPA